MGKIILYHGTQNKIVTPVFGGGNDKHDYGRGFYLTEVLNLAKEWAVCVPNSENGWVHKYELDCTGLKILDFQEKGFPDTNVCFLMFLSIIRGNRKKRSPLRLSCRFMTTMP